jgi:hypothetical protein
LSVSVSGIQERARQAGVRARERAFSHVCVCVEEKKKKRKKIFLGGF